jgi:hypothetical protein
MIRSLNRPAGFALARAHPILCRAQLQKILWDATALLSIAPPQADSNSPRRTGFAFDSTPQKGWMRQVQRLATALTITTVVNNPPAIATVVK